MRKTTESKGLLGGSALASALVIAVAAAALPARAATYILPTDEALVQKSDAVVRGRVVDVRSVLEHGGGIHTEVTVAIDRLLKGSAPGTSVVIEHPGGTVGKRRDVYPGTGSFTKDEEVVLMLTASHPGRWQVTDFALGKLSVLTEDGREVLRRDGLADADILNRGTDGSLTQASSVEPDRDAAAFERYVQDLARGLHPVPDYELPAKAPSTETTERTAAFEFLGNPPARRTQFEQGMSVTYFDNSSGDPGSNCNPDGCHQQVSEGVVHWNTEAPGSIINLVYGGTSNFGNKCLNNLSNEISYNDPCGDIPNLSGCSGTLALGGFSATQGGGGQPPCPAKNNPSFDKITAGRIMINNGVGSCLSRCDYEDMIAHETGHTIGAGHSGDPSALMAPFLNAGQCGVPAADDIAFAQCVYPGCSPWTITSATALFKRGSWRIKVGGANFKKTMKVEVDSGIGFAQAPRTIFKSKTLLVARDIADPCTAGTPPLVRVNTVLDCPSDPVTVICPP